MIIVPEYTNPIGVCTNCRAARREGERVVDLGSQVEMLALDHIPGVEYAIIDGDWQLCESCVTEAARLLGMETPSKVEALKVDNAGLRAALDAANTELREALEALEYRRKVQAVADRVFGEEST